MTLIQYSPDAFDAIALRFLDLAATFRELARKSRDEGLAQVPIHDKKALEWLAKLEFWAEETRQRRARTALRTQGARHAENVLAQMRKSTSRTQSPQRKQAKARAER